MANAATLRVTQMTTINLAKDFSRYPAGRYVDDGPWSGQKFREDFIIPKLETCAHLTINLDGTRGYGSSFLEEAFGGLVRSGYSSSDVLARIKLISKDPTLIMEIQDYIRNGKPSDGRD